MCHQPVPRRQGHRAVMLSRHGQRYDARAGRAAGGPITAIGGPIIEHACFWVPTTADKRHALIHILLGHVELRVFGRPQKHEMPRRDRQIRVAFLRLLLKVAQASRVLGVRFRASLQGAREPYRFRNSRSHFLRPLSADVPIDFPEHQAGDGMIVSGGMGGHFSLIIRRRDLVAKQSVFLLAGEDKINREV